MVVSLQPQQLALQAPAPSALKLPKDHPKVILQFPTLDLDFCIHAYGVYARVNCRTNTSVGSNVLNIVFLGNSDH